MLKRIIDIIVSFFAFAFLLIPLTIVSLLVYLNLGWPVLFTQKRPGKKGKLFKMYKFRTMTNDRDSNGNLLPNEVRLTKFGKFLRRSSLDELPELINVFKGEMSIVGPRPLRSEYLSYYSPEQARRHEVKPGITGWAQINGRNAISWEEKFKLDVWYVDNQSFWLDLKIIWLTFFKVLKREGVNSAEDKFVEPFRGAKLNG